MLGHLYWKSSKLGLLNYLFPGELTWWNLVDLCRRQSWDTGEEISISPQSLNWSGTVRSVNLFTFALRIKQISLNNNNKLASVYSLVSRYFCHWAQFSSLKVREQVCITPRGSEWRDVGMGGSWRDSVNFWFSHYLVVSKEMSTSLFRPQFPMVAEWRD